MIKFNICRYCNSNCILSQNFNNQDFICENRGCGFFIRLYYDKISYWVKSFKLENKINFISSYNYNILSYTKINSIIIKEFIEPPNTIEEFNDLIKSILKLNIYS